ncbi:MAG: BON domain-containing protein [Calothrix sp. SM1_7_51]|nr:BON domain-containing protein [Calothrix sp. SM1_7_51]
MKKIAPLMIAGVLMFATAACSGGDTSTSEAPSGTNQTAPTAAKEATSKTEATPGNTAKKTETTAKTAVSGVKTIVKNQLTQKIAGSKLDVAEKDGVLTVTGTVPTEADLRKIEPLIKEQKFQGVKSVKVDAKVAPKAQ